VGGHQKPNLTGINLSETSGQPCSLASASLGSLLEITGTQNNDGNIWTSAADLGYRVFHHDCAYYHELVDQFSGFEFAPANGGADLAGDKPLVRAYLSAFTPGFTQYQPVGSGAFGGLCNHHFFK
jgi:hypothetical protein